MTWLIALAGFVGLLVGFVLGACWVAWSIRGDNWPRGEAP